MARKVFLIPVELDARLAKYCTDKGMRQAEFIRRAIVLALASEGKK